MEARYHEKQMPIELIVIKKIRIDFKCFLP